MNVFRESRFKMPGKWVFATLVLAVVFAGTPAFVWAQYQGAEYCQDCHSEQYYDWLTSGHKQILMEGANAQHRSLPLPNGETWNDISYVVGGNRTKALYLDDEGYIMSGSDSQFNLLTGEWVDFGSGSTTTYDCGECHTTGYQAGGSPPGMPGISGTFALPGVQCELCHGPGDTMESGNPTAQFCGECHSNGPTSAIAAAGGFILSEGQYNEFLFGAHANLSCISCHNPHQNAEYGIEEQCEDCHATKANTYEGTIMAEAGVECKDCHMPAATLSAQALGPHQGDVRTHIFRINTDPSADMFTANGANVAINNGEAAVTLDFACQRCHGSVSVEELSKFAKDFHDSSGSLANFGLDPGLSGTWWNTAKSGEGFLIDVAYAGSTKFMYVSLYTYSPSGEQTWLVAALTSENGTTGNVDVYIPEGGTWGDPSTATTGQAWGSGSMSFPTCSAGHVTLNPNAEMMARGYTTLDYDLVRYFTPGVACPTLVHDLL